MTKAEMLNSLRPSWVWSARHLLVCMDDNAGHADHISEKWIAHAWADHNAGVCSVDFQEFRQRWHQLYDEAMQLMTGDDKGR